jgi:hypothetical protein
VFERRKEGVMSRTERARSTRSTQLAKGRFWSSLAFIACGVALSTACGSRGPLDDDGPLDSGSAADVATVDAVDASPPAPDAEPGDAAPEGGSILDCGVCLVGQCADGILACVQDPACQQTFQCVIGTCLAGGGSPDLQCLLSCASGDTQGALKIFQIFQCVTSTCGSDCNELLGGLLGGLGGGGGGGGGAKAGPRPAKSMNPFAQVISRHWPALCGPLAPSTSSSP